MRLTEFLQPTPVVEDTQGYHWVPIPMWVLEGSTADYNAFLLKRKMNSLALVEAAVDRYRPMIEVFRKIDNLGLQYGLGNAWHMGATKVLDWCMTVLKREDRIVWYLRYYKLNTLYKLASSPVEEAEGQKEVIDFINKEYQKAMAAVTRATGADDNSAWSFSNQISHHNRFDTKMEHFMSMGIPQIQQTVFSNQKPFDLLHQFRTIEQDWISKRQSVINMDDDEGEETLIMEFPDGSKWVNLNRSSCSREGGAMGHCGNGGSRAHYETVLSYRAPTDENGKPRQAGEPGNFWRPRLTFVLHKETGMLGEMKGRANNKPKDELHPVIVALLKSDLVKGITGGGYKPENNFEMDDLDPEVAAELIRQKPGLGTVAQQYAVEGASKGVVNRITSVLEQYGVEIRDYNKEKEYFIIEVFPNYESFVSRFGDRTEKYIAKMMSGDGEHHHNDWYSGDRQDREELLENLIKDRPDIWDHLQAYMRWSYPEAFGVTDQDDDQQDDDYAEDAEYDIDSISDVVRCLDDEGDDLYDQIGYAIADGHRSGAEASMSKVFWDWLAHPFERGMVVFVNPDQKYDSELHTALSLKDMMNNLPPEDTDMVDEVSSNGWKSWLEVEKLEEPQYGWDGYDEDAASESLYEQFDIPDVPDYEIPVAGNATVQDRNAIFDSIVELGGEEIKGTGAGKKSWKTPDGVRIIDMTVMNGVIIANVYVNPTENEDQSARVAKYATFLRHLAMLGRSRDCSIVLRAHEKSMADDPLVGEAGFSKTKHNYLRYDPPASVTESDDGPMRIKLRGFGSRDDEGDLEGFMHDFEGLTQEHPWNSSMRLYGSVGITLRPWNREIHLSDIVSLMDERQGNGTKALQMLTQLADTHRVKLSGTAKAYSNKPGHVQGTRRLLQWYQKNGFKRTGGYQEDGFDIEYHPRAVTEAPIDDYAMIGNWGDKERSNSFNHAQDRKIIQSPNLQQKVRRKFGNTEHILNFYFINLPGAKKYAETGLMSEDDIAKNMPEAWVAIRQRETDRGTDRENAINVLYVGNAGVNRVPMTAWIMGHRLGHAVQASNRGGMFTKAKIHAWVDFEREMGEMVYRIMDEVYGVDYKQKVRGYGGVPGWTNDTAIAKLFEAIGTMASARNGNLGGRPYEFMYELFSQYLTTGKVEFRELPRSFGMRGGVNYWVRDEESREMYSRDLNGWWADHITSYMDNVCYECNGKYLIM